MSYILIQLAFDYSGIYSDRLRCQFEQLIWSSISTYSHGIVVYLLHDKVCMQYSIEYGYLS